MDVMTRQGHRLDVVLDATQMTAAFFAKNCSAIFSK